MSEESGAPEGAQRVIDRRDIPSEGRRLPSIILIVPWDFPVNDFGEFLQARDLQMVWSGRTQRVFEVMPK